MYVFQNNILDHIRHLYLSLYLSIYICQYMYVKLNSPFSFQILLSFTRRQIWIRHWISGGKTAMYTVSSQVSHANLNINNHANGVQRRLSAFRKAVRSDLKEVVLLCFVESSIIVNSSWDAVQLYKTYIWPHSVIFTHPHKQKGAHLQVVWTFYLIKSTFMIGRYLFGDWIWTFLIFSIQSNIYFCLAFTTKSSKKTLLK